MKLINELIDAYLDNHLEHPYYLDLQTGEVVLDLGAVYTGEPGIDWDDEENEERYVDIPKVGSDEAYRIMIKFAQRTPSDPEDKLFDALNENRPFRKFKDMIYRLDLEDEWYAFERDYAAEQLKYWLERNDLDYKELSEKYNQHHTDSKWDL
ncbi:UPF0158 family protein [Paenibacillus sp. J5C2022]|uniref:UPF0158 family protein n=1 Tax=Paenibacillus sp. J5C2022 TaxID=2977129 RepID=UPI0021D1F5EA|nr:UPF0158 family protein [Paenibacillus sp. J5C2022]